MDIVIDLYLICNLPKPQYCFPGNLMINTEEEEVTFDSGEGKQTVIYLL